MRLLVVSGSPPDSSFSRAPARMMTPQPPGPGIALAGAVGEHLDFGQLGAHAASSPAGSLNTIRSSTPSTGSSVTVEPLGERVDHLADQHFRAPRRRR